MENLTRADSRLLPGFGPGQGIISGQGVRFPLLIQVERDEDLELPGMDEKFIEEAMNWKSGKQAEAANRTKTFLRELDD
jgi:uncharacterized protein